jgi:putative ABC transport system substrate-binding protein
MPEKLLFCLLTIALLSTVPFAEAQQTAKVPRIGYLAGAGSSPNQAFVQGMRDLGYIEGKNIAFVYRTTEGKSVRWPDLAAELVQLKVEIIVADGTLASVAAKKATSTIPIIMTSGTDPVGTGLVASLARPGGNVTGLTSVAGELGGKLLELLKEIVPRLDRVAILSPVGPARRLFLDKVEAPARALKLQLLSLPIRGPEEIEGAFRAMSKEQSNGLLVRLPARYYSAHLKRVAELSVKNRLPSISPGLNWANDGGLISYGSATSVRYRRTAWYVDKILKGVMPGDLPVEAPMKFELVINLKTAKQIGLTIPPEVLMRANKVIK